MSPELLLREVDVIVPTVALDGYLWQAVGSLLADGLNADQIVVVVDGPPVLSDAPEQVHPGVQVLFTGIRSGSAVAINCGILATHHRYIARLDADDLSKPGRFSTQLEYMESHPEVVLLGSRARLISANGLDLGRFWTPTGRPVKHQLTRGNPFVHSSLVLRRKALSRSGLYDPDLVRMQDYDLILRLALVGDVAILPEELVAYRVHSGQHSVRAQRFWSTWRTVARRRRSLARLLQRSPTRQVVVDLLFGVAQVLRYAGLRKPRYLRESATWSD